MLERVWPVASGGLIEAANLLFKRCEVESIPLNFEDEKNKEALKQAKKIINGNHVDDDHSGLGCLAFPLGHHQGNPLTDGNVGIKEPWDAFDKWEAACPSVSFRTELDLNQLRDMAKSLRNMMLKAIEKQDYDQLDQICTEKLSFLPAYPSNDEDGDISLYDYGKMISALASCFVQKETVDDSIKKEKSLLLYSYDFSGIQNFIYLITTKDALKMLRGRSFFLELMMENVIDELLSECGLTHANCMYAGGGHAYLLLPKEADETIKKFDESVNKWLRVSFKNMLYLASGSVACSPDDIFQNNGEEAYNDIFRDLSHKIGEHKLHRYSAEALKELNSEEPSGRECKICGRIIENQNDEGNCDWCDALIDLGKELINDQLLFAVTDNEIKGSDFCRPIPSSGNSRFISIVDEKNKDKIKAIRWYVKKNIKRDNNNKPKEMEYPQNCRRIYAGDYCPTNILSDLTDNETETGIDRLGILRADVDNLGSNFIQGFKNKDGSENYTSMIRTASFSRFMSIFFKKYINDILEENDPNGGVLVVYSGGDDIFLAGGWRELIDSTLAIRKAFAEFTNHKLTFSAGFGLYRNKYPIAKAALETAELEDYAKDYTDPNKEDKEEKGPTKDAVSLFAAQEELRWGWNTFEDDVVKNKKKILEDFFNAQKKETFDIQNSRGRAFLYRLLELLRRADEENGKINLARCAYLLTRLRPEKKNEDSYHLYDEFSKKFYSWATDVIDRRQLVLAIYLYVYENREKRGIAHVKEN